MTDGLLTEMRMSGMISTIDGTGARLTARRPLTKHLTLGGVTAMAARKSIPLKIRFWKFVDKSQGCWLWTGVRNNVGYGRINPGGGSKRYASAHRISWLLAHGQSPPRGMCVLHRCDNRLCVNPDHLFLGTNSENMADMVGKGRAAKGEKNVHAKLTLEQVRHIRRSKSEGAKVSALAKQFGVTQATIYYIVSGTTWREARD